MFDFFHLFDGDDEYGVGTRGGFIHVGSGSGSGFGTDFHEFEDFLRFNDCPLWDAFDVDTFSGVFSDLKVFFLVPEEVANDFVVDLNVGSSDHESCLNIKYQIRLHLHMIGCTGRYLPPLSVQYLSRHRACYTWIPPWCRFFLYLSDHTQIS